MSFWVRSSRELKDLKDKLNAAELRAESAEKNAMEFLRMAVAKDRLASSRSQNPYILKAKPKLRLPAMFHDGRFTYIDATYMPGQFPMVYELVNRKPARVDFSVENNTMVISKVLDKGYLVFETKDKATFSRRPE